MVLGGSGGHGSVGLYHRVGDPAQRARVLGQDDPKRLHWVNPGVHRIRVGSLAIPEELFGPDARSQKTALRLGADGMTLTLNSERPGGPCEGGGGKSGGSATGLLGQPLFN
jgi:hypothetical protein